MELVETGMMRVMVMVMVAELAEVPVLVDMVELMEVIVDQVKILLMDEVLDMETMEGSKERKEARRVMGKVSDMAPKAAREIERKDRRDMLPDMEPIQRGRSAAESESKGAQLARVSEKAPDHQEAWELKESRCLLYTSPSPRDLSTSRMPSSA